MRNLISFIGGLAWGYLTFRRQVPGGLSICRDFRAQTFHKYFFTPINFISFYQKKIYSHTVILDATLIREK